MSRFNPRAALRRFREREALRPDLARGLRATLGFMVPWLLGAAGWLPLNTPFVCFAAQSVAIVDIRGAYTLRLGLLLAMTGLLGGAAALAGGAAGQLPGAVLAMAVIALLGGAWRHFTPDYGASLAISSAVLFLLALSLPAGTGWHSAAASTAAGGLWGLLLQVANWPVRPQHPLRRSVSDSWLAVADLCEALAQLGSPIHADDLHAREAALRTTLDHAYAALAPVRRRPTPLHHQLQELNLAAARLATRVSALGAALEAALHGPDAAWLAESFQPLLASLRNLARSVAVTVVSRQPSHLAAGEVRLRRLDALLRAFLDETPARVADAGVRAQLREILRDIEQQLPSIHGTLRATIDRAGERAAFSLELFDLDTWTLRPLASALNLRRHVDPALIRFTLRSTVLMMAGVAVFEGLHVPHGYWLPLTTIIVLQPDYGSTRQRAAQRVLGTLAGSVAASLLLWLEPSPAGLAVATAATIFAFGYFLKRRYAVAVCFITLLVVLLTEAQGPVTIWFTAERLGATLAGGALALLAALFFWPVWERDRLPAILARAFEANRAYLRAIAARLAEGGAYDDAVIAAKRRAEAANGAAFSSLQRMMGDPLNQQAGLEHAAALANGGQRLTRGFTALALQLAPGRPLRSEPFSRTLALAEDTLAALSAVTQPGAVAPDLRGLLAALAACSPTADAPPDDSARVQALRSQLARIVTELRALLLAAEAAAEPLALRRASS